jgi:hypothetical protein
MQTAKPSNTIQNEGSEMKRFHITHWVGMGVMLMGGVLPMCALSQVQLIGQNSAVQQSALPSSLQVTGTTQAFSVLSNRADVQDVLQAVFAQGKQQFTLDSGVSGTVSLRLLNQPLKRVLDSICAQTFLKYQIQGGVFVFSRDEDAVRRAILQIKNLNVQLRDQLRALGLDVPPEANFYAFGRGGAQPAPGNLVGGFGGGGGVKTDGAQNNTSEYPKNYVRRNAPPGVQELLAGQPRQGGRAQNDAANSKRATTRDETQGGRLSQNSAVNGVNGPMGGVSLAPEQDAYATLLKSNGLYGVNTQGEQVPVSDILTELGKQAGVTVLLDPDLPKDARFRMRAKLPPRTLDETLNMLTSGAFLEWRKVGNTIIVSPTPEFQVFFGNDAEPKLSYPNAQNSSRSRSGEASKQKPEEKKDVKDSKSEPGKPKDGKG